MGAGFHGGFGATKGAGNYKSARVSLPRNKDQLNHIFGNRTGHLPDTPGNRRKLIRLANDKSSYVGKDKYGNSWHAKIQKDGTQLWVRHRSGTINDGGRNDIPRSWDPNTGLNKNPFSGR